MTTDTYTPGSGLGGPQLDHGATRPPIGVVPGDQLDELSPFRQLRGGAAPVIDMAGAPLPVRRLGDVPGRWFAARYMVKANTVLEVHAGADATRMVRRQLIAATTGLYIGPSDAGAKQGFPVPVVNNVASYPLVLEATGPLYVYNSSATDSIEVTVLSEQADDAPELHRTYELAHQLGELAPAVADLVTVLRSWLHVDVPAGGASESPAPGLGL